MDAIQQWEVALLGSAVALLINILSVCLKYTASTSQPQVLHPPCVCTTTPMSPLPPTILIMGVTDAPTAMATSSGEGTTPLPHGGQETP